MEKMGERGMTMEPHHPELHVSLAAACDYLEHYHIDHTDDKITRFRGKRKGRTADIYVVADPDWKRRFREFTKDEFPQTV